MRTLYLSHNGMTEPLGESQVLAYMIGLARRGVEVEIISFEPAGTPSARIDDTRARLDAHGVAWRPLVRSRSHSPGRKVWEIGSAFLHGLSAALSRRPDIVHARSYLPAIAADAIARWMPSARFLFDVRGMLADEYVDAGHWTETSLRYRALKLYEGRLFRRADGVVVLTRALLQHLRATRAVPDATPMEVIPCCVDTARFRVDPETRIRTRAALGLTKRTVVIYSGTLGSWYMAREMATFVATLRSKRDDVAWLLLTRADPSELLAFARARGLERDDVIVRRAEPAEMPSFLAAGDVGLSMIRPCFSKLGSSPTKVAEYLACGLATVMNAGVGDASELAEAESCIVLPANFDEDAVARAAERVAALLDRPYSARAELARKTALERFGLENVGVPRYDRLYQALLHREPLPNVNG